MDFVAKFYSMTNELVETYEFVANDFGEADKHIDNVLYNDDSKCFKFTKTYSNGTRYLVRVNKELIVKIMVELRN